MTTKAAIISTFAILLLTIAISLALLFMLVDPKARNAKARAEKLGQGIGVACVLPIGIVWITWAVRFRKERERKLREPD